MDDGMNIKRGQNDLKPSFDASASRMLKVDVERYQSYLDGMDMSAAQKEEFLQAMWLMMVSFVELGFEIHPVQEVCGKLDQNGTESAIGASDALELKNPKDENNEQEPHP
jgi:hypothetical protein